MKNLLLIISLVIFYSYGCKSSLSHEYSFPGNNSWSNKGRITKEIYTKLIKNIDPIGLYWDDICNKNKDKSHVSANYSVTDRNVYIRFFYTEKRESPSYNANVTHQVTLTRAESFTEKYLQYKHEFNENFNLSTKVKSDIDVVKFHLVSQYKFHTYHS